jgi:RimJ/RimL family protein N-acetyltransferase
MKIQGHLRRRLPAETACIAAPTLAVGDGRITLRSFTANDIANLQDWVSDPLEVLRWAGGSLSFPIDAKAFREFWISSGLSEAVSIAWTAIDRSGAPIGHIELTGIDRRHSHAHLRRVLVGDESRRHRGIGSGMVSLVVAFAFEGLGLHRVSLNVLADNLPAIRCYERLGFRREGLLRQTYRSGGTWLDTVPMARLREGVDGPREEVGRADSDP